MKKLLYRLREPVLALALAVAILVILCIVLRVNGLDTLYYIGLALQWCLIAMQWGYIWGDYRGSQRIIMEIKNINRSYQSAEIQPQTEIITKH